MSTDGPEQAPRRGPQRVERLLAVALVLQLGAGVFAAVALRDPAPAAGVVDLRARPAPAESGTSGDPQRAALLSRDEQVGALLEARAAAVRAGDREAFLSTVDPEAFLFRVAQERLFDALAEVPLGTWEYELTDRRQRQSDDRLDRRYGADRWWAPDVRLRYALAGFDDEPTSQEHFPTFVLRGDRWLLAADADFPDAVTERGIWDAGPVVPLRSERALVLGHPGSEELMRAIADVVDEAVPRVTGVWGPGWAQRVVVLVPDDASELTGLLGPDTDLTQIAAVATAEIGQDPDDPGSFRPVGDRVVVNPVNFSRLGPLGRRVVLTHEVAHVATRQATGPAAPTWLVEGFADHVGYTDVDVPLSLSARELRNDVRAGQLPDALPDDDAFQGSDPALAQAYQMSWLAVRLIVEQHGEPAALRFYRAVGARRGVTPAQAVESAFASELGTTTAAFTAAWRDALRRQLA